MTTSKIGGNIVLDLPFIVEETIDNEIILKTKPHGHLSKKDREKFNNRQVTVKIYVFSEEDIREIEDVKISHIVESSKFNDFLYGLLNSVKNIILK